MSDSRNDSAGGKSPAFDLTRCYVRFVTRRSDGFVEFEFAMGDTSLCVELIMPDADYQAFCCNNNVTFIE